MMPAAKHGDPQLGIDIHMCTTPVPAPLPTPHMSVVFDPFDYIPILGATVTVCGMKRATAGTSGIAVHIPPGFPFAPMLPQKDDELFMGSATVVADGDPFSYIALPVLSCQVAGIPSIPRPRKKGPKKMLLGPLVFNLAIPTNVFVGGPPTISMMGMAMQGAFAGLGKIAKSGVFKRMRQKLFKNMNPGFLKCTILRAEPVNILSGAVSVEHEDFVLPGRIPIEWRRVYGSDNPHAGQCGHGWETPADGRLEIDHDGVLMHYPGVGPLYFNGVPTAEGEAAAELELQDGAVLTDVAGEYRVRTKEDRIYHFPKAALVHRPDGGQSIALSKIADLCGNHLQFERHGGVLTAIHESAGRRLDFRTDAGRIQRIALITPESPERHAYVRYDYDTAGDLVAVRDALDQPCTFAYDAHHLVRHTDRNGLSFYYEYDATTAERRVVHAWGDGGLYDYRFEYSDVLRERRITDSLGNVSVVKLSEQGLPINEIDALGGVTIYEYDDAGRTVAVTDQDGGRTGYEYDERGNLLRLTRADGTCVAAQFDTLNKATTVTDPNGASWQQVWDQRALLIEHKTPLGHLTRYEYDAHGQLVGVTDPRGARTELRFDVYGNLARLRDALGHSVRFGYDELGNITGKLDASNVKTLYTYDAKGRLTAVRAASGSQVSCGYDPEDNLTHYRDENGADSRIEYRGLGEVAKLLQPDGHHVEYYYDTEEQLLGVCNQRGEKYQFRRDALGRIVEETDYWGQSRRYDYSAAGYLKESVDPLQRRTSYVRDPVGRVLKKILQPLQAAAAGAVESFEYDAVGNMLAAQNPQLRVEREYDAEGRMLMERQGEAFTIHNTYDEVGNRIIRLTELEHGSGTLRREVRFHYDLLGQVSEIAADDHPAVHIERNAAGQIVAEGLAPHLRRELSYDADGNLTQQRVRSDSGAFDTQYSHDAAGNLTQRVDSVLGADQFIYDPLGRITQHLDPQGKLHQYLNDPAGDRLRTQVREKVRESAIESASAQWWREGTYEGATYRFDRAGNLVWRHDERGEIELSWDADQRLIHSCLANTVTTYRYDALGRRILTQSGAQLVRFFWDGDALVADAASDNDSCGVVREWVYFPDTFEPLLLLSGAGPASILYYHNDPNGCPVRLTDASGELKWAASHTVWGGIAHLHTAAVDQPLRLQGQYADAATGLHYNRRRYFDPHIGCFISPDPIGLVSSLNPYEVAANLLGWADPSGLVCGPAVRQNVRGRWIDVRGRFARAPSVAGLQRLKGRSVGHVEAILGARGYTRTNPLNAKNQRWRHPDGSEVQIHAYGNQVTGPFKASNNAHAHKSLGRHGQPGTTELADDGVTAVNTHSAAAHIGLKNPLNFPALAGRPHGS